MVAVFLLVFLQSLPLAATYDLTGIPQCGLGCLVASLPVSPCSSTNTTCLCADAQYNDVVTTCVRNNCTVRESLTTKNITWTGCGHPTSNHDTLYNALLIVFFTLPVLCVAARIAAKVMKLSRWGPDDTTICVAFACCVVFFVAAVLEAQAGLGRDFWTLSFDQITLFLKVFFVCEVVYTFGLAMIKASFLLFFLRVFGETSLRITLWATVVFNGLLGVTFIIVDLAQCRPIDLFWTGWDGEHAGSCININAMAWAHACINIALDVWMLILPATQIFKLRLTLGKKAGVLLMFSVGAFLTVISIVRLTSLVAFNDSVNPTVDYFGVAVYSTLELQVGVICACMPAIHHLSKRIIHITWPTLATPASSLAMLSASIKTVGRQALRRRQPDTGTALQTFAARLGRNSEGEYYNAQRRSQVSLVGSNRSLGGNGAEAAGWREHHAEAGEDMDPQR